jgi:hypothetical protein
MRQGDRHPKQFNMPPMSFAIKVKAIYYLGRLKLPKGQK